MAMALMAWLRAPAPMTCTMARLSLRMTPASAPATEFGLDLEDTLRSSTTVLPTLSWSNTSTPSGRIPSSELRESRSAGVFGSPGLAHHHHADLPRVGQLGLDLLGDVASHPLRGEVVDHTRVDHHPDVAPRLHGIGLDHSGVGLGDRLQSLEALDVGLD